VKQLVSVILTSYNKAAYLAEAIESVLTQTHQNWELLIIDDGSTDDSKAIIKKYCKGDKRIRAFFPDHGGPSAATNTGFQKAKGQYVAIFSCDDVCEPERLEMQLAAMELTGCEAVTSHAIAINERGEQIDSKGTVVELFNAANVTRENMLLFFCLHGNYLCAPAMMMTQSVIKKTGYFDVASMQFQDFDYWIRLLKFTPIHICQTPLLRYRIFSDESSLSSIKNAVRSQNEMFFCQDTLFNQAEKILSEGQIAPHINYSQYKRLTREANANEKKFILVYFLFLASTRKERNLLALRRMHAFIGENQAKFRELFWHHFGLTNQIDCFRVLPKVRGEFGVLYYRTQRYDHEIIEAELRESHAQIDIPVRKVLPILGIHWDIQTQNNGHTARVARVRVFSDDGLIKEVTLRSPKSKGRLNFRSPMARRICLDVEESPSVAAFSQRPQRLYRMYLEFRQWLGDIRRGLKEAKFTHPVTAYLYHRFRYFVVSRGLYDKVLRIYLLKEKCIARIVQKWPGLFSLHYLIRKKAGCEILGEKFSITTKVEAKIRAVEIMPESDRFYILDVAGWCCDVRTGEPPREILVYSDARIVHRFRCNQRRPDVARHFELVKNRRTGFHHHLKLPVSSGLSLKFIGVFANGDAVEFFSHTDFDPTVASNGRAEGKIGVVGKHYEGRKFAAGVIDEIEVVYFPKNSIVSVENELSFLVMQRRFSDPKSLAERKAAMEFFAQAPPKTGFDFRPVLGSRLFPFSKTDSTTPNLESLSGIHEYESPRVFPELNARKIERTVAPDQRWFRLKTVKVIHSALVITENGELFRYDSSMDTQYRNLAGLYACLAVVPGLSSYTYVRAAPKSIRKIRRGVLIDSRTATNYFHWMIENMPRLMLVMANAKNDGIPFIVPDYLPKTIYEMLDIAFADCKFIRRRASETLLVEDLIIPPMLTYIPDQTEFSWSAIAHLPKAELIALRERILAAPTFEPGKFPAKIFLERSGHLGRSVINHAELKKIAESEGFHAIDPGALSFRDQVSLFRGASAIIGASGAAMANLIFCKQGCRVMSLVSDRNIGFPLYSRLADIFGLDFVHLSGPSVKPRFYYASEEEFYHSTFRVSPRIFKQALFRLDKS